MKFTQEATIQLKEIRNSKSMASAALFNDLKRISDTGLDISKDTNVIPYPDNIFVFRSSIYRLFFTKTGDEYVLLHIAKKNS